MRDEDAQLLAEIMEKNFLDVVDELWEKAKKKGWKGRLRFMLWFPVFVFGYGLMLWGRIINSLIQRVRNAL